MDRFLHTYFTQIGAISIVLFIFYAYLHYELSSNNRDLIYWQNLLRHCLIEIGRYKYAYTFIISIAVLNIVIICIILTYKSSGNSWLEEEERESKLKERYRNLLLIRLLNAIDKIEMRYLKTLEPGKSIGFENLVRAHDEMWSAIVEFRKDGHKLYKLNETEVWMPLEDVFCLLENEEKEVLKSCYYREQVTIDYDSMAALLYE